MDFSQLLAVGSLLFPPQHPSREQVAPLLSMRSWSCHKAGGAVFTSPGWERGVGSPGNNAGNVEHVAGRAVRGQRRFPCRWCAWAARVGHLSPATSPHVPSPTAPRKGGGSQVRPSLGLSPVTLICHEAPEPFCVHPVPQFPWL